MNEMKLNYILIARTGGTRKIISFFNIILYYSFNQKTDNQKQKYYNFPINSSECCLLSEDFILLVYCDESVHNYKFKAILFHLMENGINTVEYLRRKYVMLEYNTSLKELVNQH